MWIRKEFRGLSYGCSHNGETKSKMKWNSQHSREIIEQDKVRIEHTLKQTYMKEYELRMRKRKLQKNKYKYNNHYDECQIIMLYRKTNITFESTTTKLKKSHHRKSKTWSLYPHPHPYRNRYHCVIGVFSWIFLMIFSRRHASRTRGEQSEMLESISRKKNTSRKQTFFPKCK